MGKNKLKRFRENQEMQCVVEPTPAEVQNGLHLRGKWNEEFFQNDRGIVLELGCGKGEYTVELGRRSPDKNHIGVDIKGARLWRGAKTATEEGLTNVGYLRTRIDWINHCFGPNEVDEIWITFPDPQIKYKRAKHRLTHPSFLLKYASVLKPGGTINLKSDSEFLHGYTLGLLEILGIEVEESYHDIYDQIRPNEGILFDVVTHYERIWLGQKKAITYLSFKIDHLEERLKQFGMYERFASREFKLDV